MKLKIVLFVMILTGLFLVNREAKSEEPALKSDKEKTSYALGVNYGMGVKQLGVDMDIDVFLRALKNAYTGEKLQMSEADIDATLKALSQQMRAKAEQAQKEKGDDNKKKGDAFLAENKKNKDVVALPSGLQYKILKAGTGKKPAVTDSVEVNYKGMLIDGSVFDASPEGKPLTLKLQGVIPGWTEALQLMPVGSKWKLFIPPGLAYGERGAGQRIGPNATLVFEVELVSIK